MLVRLIVPLCVCIALLTALSSGTPATELTIKIERYGQGHRLAELARQYWTRRIPSNVEYRDKVIAQNYEKILHALVQRHGKIPTAQETAKLEFDKWDRIALDQRRHREEAEAEVGFRRDREENARDLKVKFLNEAKQEAVKEETQQQDIERLKDEVKVHRQEEAKASEEKKTIEGQVNLVVAKIGELTQTKGHLESSLKPLKGQVDGELKVKDLADAELTKLTNLEKESKQGQVAKKLQIESINQQVTGANKAVDDLMKVNFDPKVIPDSEIHPYKEKVTFAKNLIIKVTADVSKLTAEKETKRKVRSELERQLPRLIKAEKDALAALAKVEGNARLAEERETKERSEMDMYRKAISDAEAKLSQAERERIEVQAQLDGTTDEIESAELMDELKGHNDSKTKANHEKLAAQIKVNSQQRLLDAAVKQKADLVKQVANQKALVQRSTDERLAAERKIADHKEREAYLTLTERKLTAQIRSFKQNLGTAENELSKFIESYRVKLDKLAKARLEEHEAKLLVANRELNELVGREAKARDSKVTAEGQAAGHQVTLDRLNNELKRVQGDVRAVNSELVTKQNELIELRKKLTFADDREQGSKVVSKEVANEIIAAVNQLAAIREAKDQAIKAAGEAEADEMKERGLRERAIMDVEVKRAKEKRALEQRDKFRLVADG